MVATLGYIELDKIKKAICLILDNCTAHPNVSLKNIKLEFLRPNTTSLIQPLDMDVIQNVKVKYRVKYILEKIEDNLLQPKSTAIGITKKIKQAIQLISNTWRDVSNQTIKNCFRKCGFSEESHAIHQQLEPNSKEHDIVRVLNNVEFEHLDSYEDINEEPDPPIRLKKVKKSSETLRLFFLQQENERSPISALDACSDYIHQESIICKEQSNIYSLFR
ncbi:DDE superfamily endonuclease domain [Cinara cedri]|uniref:DDE superfamily endonuclease domain n=1 Tax=Cinara cedri TaxID=506608 RepID=A0A5E4MK10_9HEMI|nr:DDE superfamily endonuclease domain [Cinara cedri]